MVYLMFFQVEEKQQMIFQKDDFHVLKLYDG